MRSREVQKRLRQRARPSPDADPQRSRIIAFQARTIARDPSDDLPGPTAAIPYALCPVNTRASSSLASGHPFACSSRFGRTCPNTPRSTRCIVSACVFVFCQVDVVAIIASMSNSFEYSRNRTNDIWSSGSLPISLMTTTRGLPLKSSTWVCARLWADTIAWHC